MNTKVFSMKVQSFCVAIVLVAAASGAALAATVPGDSKKPSPSPQTKSKSVPPKASLQSLSPPKEFFQYQLVAKEFPALSAGFTVEKFIKTIENGVTSNGTSPKIMGWSKSQGGYTLKVQMMWFELYVPLVSWNEDGRKYALMNEGKVVDKSTGESDKVNGLYLFNLLVTLPQREDVSPSKVESSEPPTEPESKKLSDDDGA